MFGRGSEQINTFDITEVGHIERIVVGSTVPNTQPSQEDINKQMSTINRCLTDYPKGRIIGIERSFSVVRIGEHQVVLESVAYHIGFKKVPLWLEEIAKPSPTYQVDINKVQNIIKENT